MSRLILDISMSLDGYVAGLEPTLDRPLGVGGDRLHGWMVELEAFRKSHGMPGGETNEDSEIFEESTRNIGATVMGRRMFSGGEGAWEDDPNADAWFGDDPPFRHPVFILTHHSRDQVTKPNGTTYTFVTGGIEEALDQARAAAGDRDIRLAGGAEVVQQYLRAGLLDELSLHVVPVFLGGGTRLFERHVAGAPAGLVRTRVAPSPTGVVHLWYRPEVV